jgi:hypothetical protein
MKQRVTSDESLSAAKPMTSDSAEGTLLETWLSTLYNYGAMFL